MFFYFILKYLKLDDYKALDEQVCKSVVHGLSKHSLHLFIKAT